MSDLQSITFQVKAFSADGYELLFTLTSASLADAASKLNLVRAAGYLPFQPAPVDSERQTIHTVMRHVNENGITVIACYPKWQYEGKYGEYKFASIYLDTPEDSAQFEAQSGLKLADLPICDGEAGVRRKYGKQNPKEITVKTPFDMIKIQDGMYDDDKPRYRYDYVTRVQLAANPTWKPEQVQKFVQQWEADGLSQSDLTKALKVARWSDWKGTVEEAHAAVKTYVAAQPAADDSH